MIKQRAKQQDHRDRKPIGRPPVFQERIYRELRERIVSGELGPGVKIPTRRALCLEFDASTVTIQHAVERLINDDFLVAEGARGTFVTATPPHLNRYALVFPTGPNSNHFWIALSNEADRLRKSENLDLVTFFNIDGHVDRQEYRELESEVVHHRFAGIIFASAPYHVKDTPLLTEPGIPRSFIASAGVSDYGCTRVAGQFHDIISRAAEMVKEKGRSQVALLTNFSDANIQGFIEELGKRGITIPPWWIQCVPHEIPEGARNLAHLLAKGTDGVRPDTLIIANDNLVEPATLGLIDAGIRVPDDLLVITHFTYPWPPRNYTPVIRVGHSAGEYLRECIAAIDLERQGGTNPPVRYVQSIMEEEADPIPENAPSINVAPAS